MTSHFLDGSAYYLYTQHFMQGPYPGGRSEAYGDIQNTKPKIQDRDKYRFASKQAIQILFYTVEM